MLHIGIAYQKMPLLRFPKLSNTHKIKIEKSLKRVDSDSVFWCLDFTNSESGDSGRIGLLRLLIVRVSLNFEQVSSLESEWC